MPATTVMFLGVSLTAAVEKEKAELAQEPQGPSYRERDKKDSSPFLLPRRLQMPEVSETVTCWISKDLVGEAASMSILAPTTPPFTPGPGMCRDPLTQSGHPRSRSGWC